MCRAKQSQERIDIISKMGYYVYVDFRRYKLSGRINNEIVKGRIMPFGRCDLFSSCGTSIKSYSPCAMCGREGGNYGK